MTSRNKNDVKKLFEFWVELALDGSIIESFPENFRDKKTIADIPSFAFPCKLEGDAVELYSFVLTTDDSKWRFGFCRQDPKAKSAMVLITYLPWHDTFLRFLKVLAELRRHTTTDGPNGNEFRLFIAEAYNRGIPDPGMNFKLYYNAGLNNFVFERPRQFQLPSILENHNLNLYYSFSDPKSMIAVFAAMLAERRIIFTSLSLDRLSSCIQAAHAFLYPMVWQHIFIPVLPMKLKDYLSAPMPYLIGVPKPVLEMVTPEELGEVVIMNCDTKFVESPFDDVHDLPQEVVTQLKKNLSNSNEHIGDRVSKIFLGVLVQLIGTYRDGVEFRESGKVFNRDRFIESRPTHLRSFLTKMMELQIFQQFIDERLEMLNTGLGFSDEFEMETARYAEKLKKRGRNYAFLKNVKDKTNPAVKSAVKSVKESSRGVKTAYKDLKSKFRDIPGAGTNFRSHLSSNSHHDRIDGGYQLNKANGGAIAIGGHRSAPSSPVFSKRSVAGSGIGVGVGVNNNTTNNIIKYGTGSPKIINGATQYLRRAPAPLATSSSSAHIHSVASHSLAHHANHLGASPTISPASSLCSSDMNLSQELQNHPLFKSPAVDRSLKPCGNTTELHTRISANPPPERPPPPQPAAQYYNHPYMAHRSATQLQLVAYPHIATKPPAAAAAAMPRFKLFGPTISSPPVSVSSSSDRSIPPPNQKIITTDSTYDNPPEMQSPPIPPRRLCNNNNNNNSNSVSESHSFHSSTDSSDCFRDPQRTSSSNTSTISSASSSSGASFVSAMSSFSQQHINATEAATAKPVPVPVPVPRYRREKESLRSLQPQPQQQQQQQLRVQQPSASAAGSLTSVVPSTSSQEDTINDLISLDDSHNSSFDLEDFDPLNQNARPLPLCGGGGGGGTAKGTTVKSTTLPTTSSISNPLYPYFTSLPQPNNINCRTVLDTTPPSIQQPPPLPTSSPPRDDDFELLRKYGLDQFTLTTAANGGGGGGGGGPNGENGVSVSTRMRNWTTFD